MTSIPAISPHATSVAGKSRCDLWPWVGCCLLLAMLNSGCSRTHYRLQADNEGLGIIGGKANNPHWAIDHYHLQPEKTSRLYDPYDPDHEPMPLDDPTAHGYMHKVDNKRGYPRWHKNGETPFAENPNWLAYLPLNPQGEMELSAQEAVKQGLRHSPTYQRELEEVYLSALDVSFERFRFDTQFFAGSGIDYTSDGPNRNNAGDASSVLTLSTFPTARGVRAQRLFTTGADAVVGFANSLVWQFAGPDDYQGNTLIDFAITQPLLRNAGRDRVMERLTRSERTLLYNVRSLERYRQAYYVQILTGRDPGQGPARGGGVFGGSGFDGFSGVGGGGFGRVTGATTAGGASASGSAGAGAQQAGGYLGLLQAQQQIQNQEDNIVRLRDNVLQLETQLLEQLTTRVAADVILRQRLQVAQARQALLNAQSRLLNARNDFGGQVDNFKAVLGLPPQLCLVVRDTLLDDFQLIDRDTSGLQRQVQEIIENVGDVNRRIHDRFTESTDENGRVLRELPWSEELGNDLQNLWKETEAVEGLANALHKQGLSIARQNINALSEALVDRSASIQALTTRFEKEKDDICRLLPITHVDPRVFDPHRIEKLPARLLLDYQRLEIPSLEYSQRIAAWREALDQVMTEPTQLNNVDRFQLVRDHILLSGQNLLTNLRFDILATQLLQARARTETIQLAKVNLKAEEALEVARQYRHDWMNARAGLVDQWRLIEFNANQLEGSLDVIFSGDVSNRGQNPFNLQSSTGRLRAGVRFDSPLTRLSERNSYRQALLEYQQARRSFYTFEDSIARGLRAQLRTITANQLNFELQRFAVSQAAEQILLNDDIRARQEATAQAARDTAARDSVSALADLLDAQNNFLSVFVNYEVLRRQLDLDLGTMQLDKEGYWLDPGVIDTTSMPCSTSQESYPEELPITDEQINQMVKMVDDLPLVAPESSTEEEVSSSDSLTQQIQQHLSGK
jgi:hypothetical protein